MVLCGCALVPDYLHVHQEAKVEFSILCHFNNWIIPAIYYILDSHQYLMNLSVVYTDD